MLSVDANRAKSQNGSCSVGPSPLDVVRGGGPGARAFTSSRPPGLDRNDARLVSQENSDIAVHNRADSGHTGNTSFPGPCGEQLWNQLAS